MKNEEQIVKKLRALPADKQQEVLDFIQFLENRSSSSVDATLKVEWSNVTLQVVQEDVTQARRQMWQAFPTA